MINTSKSPPKTNLENAVMEHVSHYHVVQSYKLTKHIGQLKPELVDHEGCVYVFIYVCVCVCV